MDSALRLRLATPADLPALAALYALAARTLGPQVYTPQQVQAWESFGRCTPDFSRYILDAETWVAEGGKATADQPDEPQGEPRGEPQGESQGVSQGEPQVEPRGFCGIDRQGEVHSLYVHPDNGRHGLGMRLASHALERAGSKGVSRFTVWATPFSRPLFERLGFALVEVRREPFQGILFDRFRLQRP